MIVSALLGLLVAGCSGEAGQQTETSSPTAAATPTPSKNLRYDSVVELRDAAVEAGYSCPNWKQDNVVTNAKQSGTCTDEDVFTIYATDSDLEAQIETTKAGD